jgi:regulator of protease activity HflC (stomatin/prohibitin superfamily)
MIRSVRKLSTKKNTTIHPNLKNTVDNLHEFPQTRTSVSPIHFGYQGYKYVIERFGKFHRTKDSGLFFTVPFIESFKVVDTRQMVLDVHRQNAYTSDNVAVSVAAQLYLTVVDVHSACYKVGQPLVAVMSKAQSVLRTIIGNYDLDHLLKDRVTINNLISSSLSTTGDEYGIFVSRFEITELSPAVHIQEAMDLQSTAERKRRSAVILAEGNKRAMELEAEGKRISYVLEAQGKKESAELEALGVENASKVYSKIPKDVMDYNIKNRHIEMVGKLAGQGHSTYFIPENISALPAMADIMKN